MVSIDIEQGIAPSYQQVNRDSTLAGGPIVAPHPWEV